MSKLWMLLFLAMLLSFAVSHRDRRLHRNGDQRHRYDKVFTIALVLLLGGFCGLRTFYNDTITYIQIYERAPLLSDFYKINSATYAHGIGFAYLNSLIKTLGFSTQDYLMFYSMITTACYVRFVRKHTNNFPLSVFLMFTTGFYTFAFAAIKQCMATAVCLFGLEFLLEGKKSIYIFFVLLASLFHPYALVYLLLLLMDFRPLTRKTYLYIGIFIAVGFGLNSIIGTIVDITTMIGASYNMASFVGEGVNIFRVLVSFVPLALAFLFGRNMFTHSTSEENVLFNMAMLNALIMFVGLFGTANYFARLANYFLPAQVVVLPWMLSRIVRRDRQLLAVLCVAGYTGYFMYGNLVQSVFDNCFSKITFWHYISSHLGA